MIYRALVLLFLFLNGTCYANTVTYPIQGGGNQTEKVVIVYRDREPEPKKTSFLSTMAKGVICFVMFGFVCVILNEPEANRKKELEKRLKIKLHRVETRLGEEKVALIMHNGDVEEINESLKGKKGFLNQFSAGISTTFKEKELNEKGANIMRKISDFERKSEDIRKELGYPVLPRKRNKILVVNKTFR